MDDERYDEDAAGPRDPSPGLARSGRGRSLGEERGEPETIWDGLVSGHYSLVELFEMEGHTYLVARRNQPRGPSLTERERTVVAWAARGLSDAETATEMKLGAAQVVAHLANAAQKLGVTSRAALVSAASAFIDAAPDFAD